MLIGLLQRMDITVHTRQRLMLRELPRLEWISAGGLLLVGVNLAIMGLYITAVAALAVALYLAATSRIRFVGFDTAADELVVAYQSPLRRQIVNRIPLEQVLRAYLRHDENDHTQVILVTQADEMGLSVYSRDLRDWKEEIVFVINEFLHNARIDREQAEQDDQEPSAPAPPEPPVNRS